MALPEENQRSWRPQDDEPPARGHSDYRDYRDYRGWQDRRDRDDDGYGERRAMRGSPGDRERAPEWSPRSDRSIERHGQGQSGHGAGRRTDARAQPSREPRPSPGSFEDRNRPDQPGLDDRFTRRGGEPWDDRTGYERDRHASSGGYRGRDFEPERHGLAHGVHRDERLGYPAGSYRSGSGGAGEIARHDAGQAAGGPHRGKGPVGYQRSDERIRELVCEALTDDDQIDASRIEVALHHGEVTLSGTVDDRRAKRDAEDCACSVPGVRDVHNQLRIAGETRGNPSAQAAVGRPETETSAQDKKHRG